MGASRTEGGRRKRRRRGRRRGSRVIVAGVRATWVACALTVLTGAGCDAVFGLGEPSREDAGLDAPPDAPIDAPPPPPDPACWLDPRYQQLETLPSARYWWSTNQMTWRAGVQTCAADGAHVVVASERDSEWMRLSLPVNPGVGIPIGHWLGLSDEASAGTWVSLTGEPVRVPGPLWGSSQPSGGAEHCAARETEGINDLPCDGYDRPVMCECERPLSCTPGSAGLEVRQDTTAAGWAGAQAACTAVGKRLAVLATAAEQEQALVLSRMYPGVTIWIDATDAVHEGDWLTSTGCRPYARWSYWNNVAREPNSAEVENCAALIDGQLVDFGCSSKAAALCELP